MSTRLSALSLALWAGCGGAPAAAPPLRAPAIALTTVPASAADVDAGPARAAPIAEAIEAPSASIVRFPPAAFAPPFARTAKPGDGTWAPMGAGAAGVMVQNTIHPDPIKGFIYVAVVAVDLSQVDVRLVAGTDEPVSASVAPSNRPGLIPEGDQPQLLAVFNGGFMAKHGGYGMMLGGDTFLPPKEDACTVALYKSGSIRIRTFSELASGVADMDAYRQTPPCLVERSTLHRTLAAEPKTRRWGTSEKGELEIRRSALGIDDTGRVLFYGLGEWVTARHLAEAMKLAGAVSAAQLDINWSYTRFLLYGSAGGGAAPEVTSTLVPKTKHASREYVAKPAERDFFYLKRRR